MKSLKTLERDFHYEERSDPVLTVQDSAKNLVFVKQSFCYANNDILRLHYTPVQNDNPSNEP